MYPRAWRSIAGAGLVAVLSVACDSSRPTAPTRAASARRDASTISQTISETISDAQLVRLLAAGRGIAPLPPAPYVRPALSRLGQSLAFDKLLSGTRDISCMTCHLPAFGTGDGKSLSVGQGGTGLGPPRAHALGTFIPRNAPPLFNLGAMRRLFWDGRVEVDARGAFHTPAGARLTPAMTRVFEFGAISALPLFPVTNRDEMRGHRGNELADIPDDDPAAIWAAIMRRLGGIPEYRGLFEAAYPGTRFDDMTFAHASNAIAGFLVDRLTLGGAPWDRFLAGRDDALSPAQLDGARTFLTLKCSICHNGPTLSDEQFHAVAVAQIGPGEGDGASARDDFGRMRVSNVASDQYRFRTTPLRNVELTGPYGHDGAIVSLRAFVEHYSESDAKLLAYDPSQLEPALRGTVLGTATAILAQRDPLLDGVVFSPTVADRLMQYMAALTDDRARDLSRVVPARVPSGLPVDRP
jgi:cytochrome c peroxidase